MEFIDNPRLWSSGQSPRNPITIIIHGNYSYVTYIKFVLVIGDSKEISFMAILMMEFTLRCIIPYLLTIKITQLKTPKYLFMRRMYFSEKL